jgi:hypothetical protein
VLLSVAVAVGKILGRTYHAQHEIGGGHGAPAAARGGKLLDRSAVNFRNPAPYGLNLS